MRLKKKLLFINNSLHSGGIEKSLVTLLSLIDYNIYEVDLQLFLNEGLFLDKIPSQVNLLPPIFPKQYGYSVKKAFIELIKKGYLFLSICRLLITLMSHTGTFGQRQKRMWAIQKRFIKNSTFQYDTVISYMEGQQIYYAVDKTKAYKKIGFIHGDYKAMNMDKQTDYPYFQKLDVICTVSESCKQALDEVFPEFSGKTHVINNIISPEFIRNLAALNVKFKADFTGIRLVTVARLSYQKGLDIAIPAVARLKDEGIRFKWYIIGIGPLKQKLITIINEYSLNDTVVFLGEQANPYPFIKAADIYMQPSRYEGKAIAVDEAMVLCKPILLTDFSTAADQITSGENGLIVPMSADGIYNGLNTLIGNEKMRMQFVKKLEQTNFGNENDIEKFYAVI